MVCLGFFLLLFNADKFRAAPLRTSSSISTLKKSNHKSARIVSADCGELITGTTVAQLE